MKNLAIAGALGTPLTLNLLQASATQGNNDTQIALQHESTTTQELNNVGTKTNNNMQEEYSLIQNINSENTASASQATQAYQSMGQVDSINQNQS